MKKLLAIPAAVLILAGCGSNDRFNYWIDDCMQMGGHISLTELDPDGDRYECFINDEVVTVPGWEGD